MHNYIMTNREPFEHEQWTTRQDVDSLYEMLQDSMAGGVGEEAFEAAEKKATEILQTAYNKGGKTMVMIDSTVLSGGVRNFFVRDGANGKYEVVRDERIVYGYVESIQHEQAQLPDAKLRLFAFIKGINRDGTFSSYALNIANEGDEDLVGCRMVQVTEPSLDIDYVSPQEPEGVAEMIRLRYFGRMVEGWFRDTGGRMYGRDLMWKVWEEVATKGLDLNEFTMAMNLRLNEGGQEGIQMNATFRDGYVYRFDPEGQQGEYKGMHPTHVSRDKYPVVAFDFSIRPDDNELVGYVYRDNGDAECLERLDLEPNNIELRIRE